MKKYLFIFLSAFLISCSMPNYYQVYKANFEGGKIENNKIVFEDNNCRINYNLWNSGGDIGFSFYNKTENDITLNLSQSFFVLNGIAHEYFQNREFSKSSNVASSTSVTRFPVSTNSNSFTSYAAASSSSYGTTFKEKQSLTIPSKTSIIITEFGIVNSRYVNCDLVKQPLKRDIKTLTFDKSNSPFVFSNLLTYSVKNENIRLENKFYVTEISNLPESLMFYDMDTSICGRALFPPITMFKDGGPNQFYFKYIE